MAEVLDEIELLREEEEVLHAQVKEALDGRMAFSYTLSANDDANTALFICLLEALKATFPACFARAEEVFIQAINRLIASAGRGRHVCGRAPRPQRASDAASRPSHLGSSLSRCRKFRQDFVSIRQHQFCA